MRSNSPTLLSQSINQSGFPVSSGDMITAFPSRYSGKSRKPTTPGVRILRAENAQRNRSVHSLGSTFTGSPCVKVVNYESYARFDRSGDLSIRMRVLNESETPMNEGLDAPKWSRRPSRKA